MSGMTEAIDHVAGILVRHDYEFDYVDGRQAIQVPFNDAVVKVNSGTYLSDPCIFLYCYLANEIPLTEETKAGIYFWVNQRNEAARFVRFSVEPFSSEDESLVSVLASWELPARDLQANEFLTALEAAAKSGRLWADELVNVFGGENFRLFCDRIDEEEAAGREEE